ncbi:MAG: hypothetical protein C0606_18070 [Hyphomicrobiales bacterium]|nr:MAG: hypothetical protein C0606_18070 [Hyphomicrobiales bacterium]
MIFHPPILALILASVLTTAMVVWASLFGVRVVRSWDITSGSQKQLELERKTYLVSTLITFVMAVELVSLFLFVFNADRMAVMFVGAMCAVGTLNVDPYGFPALYLKIGVFFAAVVWLMVNFADSQGKDYPLIRFKYGLLVGIAPLVVAAAVVQFLYFYNLQGDVITSCCSKVFTPKVDGIAAQMAGMDAAQSLWLLGAGYVVTFALAALFLKTGRGATLFALSGAALFMLGLTAVVSAISLYVYEHPHHHCPFCLLKAEYNYFGYALYIPLFGGTALALASGILSPFRKVASLAAILPGMMRRFVVWSLILFAAFGAVSAWAIFNSGLILFG